MYGCEKYTTEKLKKYLQHIIKKNDDIMDMDVEDEWKNSMIIYLYNQISLDVVRCILRSREGGNPCTCDEMLMFQLREYDLLRQICDKDSLIHSILCNNIKIIEHSLRDTSSAQLTSDELI